MSPTPTVTADDVYALLRQRISNGDDAGQAVDHLLRVTPKAELGRFIRPVLIAAAFRYQRASTRHVEEEVDRRIAAGEDPLSVRRKLVTESFPLPGVGMVRWVEATAEQHRARAGWQRSHADACIADAERHEAAAQMIEEAGVSCLGDLLDGAA